MIRYSARRIGHGIRRCVEMSDSGRVQVRDRGSSAVVVIWREWLPILERALRVCRDTAGRVVLNAGESPRGIRTIIIAEGARPGRGARILVRQIAIDGVRTMTRVLTGEDLDGLEQVFEQRRHEAAERVGGDEAQ